MDQDWSVTITIVEFRGIIWNFCPIHFSK